MQKPFQFNCQAATSLSQYKSIQRPHPFAHLFKEWAPAKLTAARTPVVVTGMYGIRKQDLEAGEMLRLQEELTVVPLSNDAVGPVNARPEPFRMYSESSDYFWMPRYFGYVRYGFPVNDQQFHFQNHVAMSDQVQCILKPDPERFQDIALRNILQCFQRREFRMGIVKLPCGYGKTGLALHAVTTGIRQLEGNNHQKCWRTAILVPSDKLVQQWATEAIPKWCPGAVVKILQGSQNDIEGCDFAVCSLASFATQQYSGLDTFGTVIVDEAHRIGARTFSQVLPRFSPKYILGISATPHRNDGLTKILQWSLGPMIFQANRKPDPDTHIHIYQYQHGGTHQNIQRRIMGINKWQFHQMFQKVHRDLAYNVYAMQQIAQIFQDPKRYILVFGKEVPHLEWVRQQLRDRFQIPETDMGFIHAKVPKADRPGLQQRRLVLMTNSKNNTDGLDLTQVNCIAFLAPNKEVEQTSGRMLRETKRSPDLPKPMLLEFAITDTIFDTSWIQKQHIPYFKANDYQVITHSFQPSDLDVAFLQQFPVYDSKLFQPVVVKSGVKRKRQPNPKPKPTIADTASTPLKKKKTKKPFAQQGVTLFDLKDG